MRWGQALRDEIMDVQVGIDANIIEHEVTLRDVMEFKAGDVIPIELPEHIMMRIEDLPTYRCKLGKSRDNLALKISEKIPRPETAKSELQLITRKKGKARDISEL